MNDVLLTTRSGRFDKLVPLLSAALPPSTWGVVTCIDSDRDPASMRTIAAQYGLHTRTGELPAALLSDMVNHHAKIFSWFDELWLFHRPPEHLATPPEEAALTSDSVDLDECKTWRGLEYFVTSGAFLAVGGGDFINFVMDRDTAVSLGHMMIHEWDL